jgi:hypothetical protein
VLLLGSKTSSPFNIVQVVWCVAQCRNMVWAMFRHSDCSPHYGAFQQSVSERMQQNVQHSSKETEHRRRRDVCCSWARVGLPGWWLLMTALDACRPEAVTYIRSGRKLYALNNLFAACFVYYARVHLTICLCPILTFAESCSCRIGDENKRRSQRTIDIHPSIRHPLSDGHGTIFPWQHADTCDGLLCIIC